MNLLSEIARVLKPSGQFVFSINVPNPGFWKVLYRSLKGGHKVSRAGRVLVNALRMQFYGRWLKQEARRGRFHFYPIDELVARLQRSGFAVTSHRVSYAGQAYVVQARRKAVAAKAA
jgi:SAM-dependent methyltransferase